MIERFVNAFKARADEAILNIEHSMGRGGCPNFEGYKFLVGQIKGLRDAMTIADELWVTFGEDEDAG